MKKEKITLAFIGCGGFARFFVPLCLAHPMVERVYVCDKIPERAQDYSKKFGTPIIDSFEEVIAREDIDGVLIFTQRHLHGDLVLAALDAGKHVYSAVPMATTVEECGEIVERVRRSGLIYMMGETCYYYPCAMFCREAYAAGRFGKFVYGASQYYHDIDAISYGKTPMEGGMPPLLYPTHSTAMILSAVDSYVKRVSCFGYRDTEGDGRFGKGQNYWDNEFSNQYVLMELANGGTARVTEARRIGWKSPSSYISALYGTLGGYEFSNAQHILVERDRESEREHVRLTDVSDYVNPAEMVAHKGDPSFMECVANSMWQGGSAAAVQAGEVARLPKEYDTVKQNGHMASHKLLIDDFVKAVVTGRQPILNAARAARYTVPGLVAIESCKQGGIPLDVPDFGDSVE